MLWRRLHSCTLKRGNSHQSSSTFFCFSFWLLFVTLCNLRPSMPDFEPCDRVVLRAYYYVFARLQTWEIHWPSRFPGSEIIEDSCSDFTYQKPSSQYLYLVSKGSGTSLLWNLYFRARFSSLSTSLVDICRIFPQYSLHPPLLTIVCSTALPSGPTPLQQYNIHVYSA